MSFKITDYSLSHSELNLEQKLPKTQKNRLFTPVSSTRVPIKARYNIEIEDNCREKLPSEIQLPSGIQSNRNRGKYLGKKTKFESRDIVLESGYWGSPSRKNKKRATIDLGKGFSNFGAIFFILKFLRERKFFRDFSNLKPLHLRLIGDNTVILPEKGEKKKIGTFTSIWQVPPKDDGRLHHLRKISNKFLQPTGQAIRKIISQEIISAFYKNLQRIPLFDSNHALKITWDVVLFCILFFMIIVYSIERAFVVDLITLENSKFFLYSVYVVIIFDIMITLNSTIYKGGCSVKKRSLIFFTYIKRNLITDVAAAVGLISHQALYYNKEYADLIVFLIFKILLDKPDLGKTVKERLIRSNRTAEAIYDMLTLAIKILGFGHIIACVWHLTSHSYNSKFPEGDSWLKENNLLGAPWHVKYLYSIYWSVTTMLTVGYGDITPRNNNEILCTICAMLFGCVLFGYSVNRIGEIIIKRGEMERKIREKMCSLKNMTRNMGLTKELETKIYHYMEFIWDQEEKVNPDLENSILSKLSPSLREELYSETTLKHLKMIPFFSKNFSENTLIKLAYHMKKVNFLPQEHVYKERSKDDSLYIIIEGKVQLIQEGNIETTVWETLGKSRFFGVHELLTGFQRRTGAKAKEFTTLYQLPRKEFMSVLKENSIDYEKFCLARENLVLYNNTSRIELLCSSCGRTDHRMQDCRFINYNPKKLMVISKMLHLRKMRRKMFIRKKKKYFDALSNTNRLADTSKEFLFDYENDEELNELKGRCEESLKYYMKINEQEMDSYENSSHEPEIKAPPILNTEFRLRKPGSKSQISEENEQFDRPQQKDDFSKNCLNNLLKKQNPQKSSFLNYEQTSEIQLAFKEPNKTSNSKANKIISFNEQFYCDFDKACIMKFFNPRNNIEHFVRALNRKSSLYRSKSSMRKVFTVNDLSAKLL